MTESPEQEIPEEVMREALEAAKQFVYPVGWTYEPSADEKRRAERDYADRLCRAARMIEPFLLSAEARGRGAQREADARIAEDDDGHFSVWGEDRNTAVAQQTCRDIATAIRNA